MSELSPELREAVETVRGDHPADCKCDRCTALALIEQRLMEYERVVEASDFLLLRVREIAGEILAGDCSDATREAVLRVCAPAIVNPHPLDDMALEGLRAQVAALSPKEKP